LGPPGPLVDEVRERLESWQRGRRDRRNIDAARKSLRRAVAKGNQVFDRELAAFGLYRKGCEIRGWRCQRGRRTTRGDVGGDGALPRRSLALWKATSVELTPEGSCI
jgi:hypothetical protein